MGRWRWPLLCERLSLLVEKRFRVNGPVEVASVVRAVESTRSRLFRGNGRVEVEVALCASG